MAGVGKATNIPILLLAVAEGAPAIGVVAEAAQALGPEAEVEAILLY